MAFNGAGIFQTLGYPDYPAQAGVLIKASQFNTNITDICNGLTNCLTRDGQSLPTGDLPMNGHKHTNVAAATGPTDYARYDQVLSPSLGGTISVNTSTPALQVTQAGSGFAILVEDQASDPTPFCVTAAGLVGANTLTPRQSLSVGSYLDLYAGTVNSPTVPSLRATATDLLLNAFGAGKVQFNLDAGTGGVVFNDGAGAAKLTIDSAGYASFANVAAMKLPSGTTAQRPGSPNFADTRINSTLSKPEWWNGAGWAPMGGGATGGGSDDAFYENTQTITTNYTLTAGKNAMTAGPVTINNAVVVTIPDGATWTVV